MTLSTHWPKTRHCGVLTPIMIEEEMLSDNQSFTDLLEACGQNLGKRPRVSASTGVAKHGRKQAPRSSILGLNVEWRQRRRVVKNVGSIVPSAGGCISPTQPRQELHILHAVRSWQHHAEHACHGQGLEQPQAKWRRLNVPEDHDIPSLFSRADSTGQQAATRGKRRRLSDESSIQEYSHRGQ